jgi:exonuclease 3'-5' domain-containing protein 1
MKDIKTEIINTTKQIGDLVDWLMRHGNSSPKLYEPTMYIDLEGVNLCREGSLSIFTLLIDTPSPRVCLIDVHSLGSQAFTSAGIKAKTLKDILQDPKIPKVFFDVRNDSDALFAHFGVALQGVQDIQLMESAMRKTTSSRKYLNGLSKCIKEGVLYGSELASWKLAKEKGGRLFKPEEGGSYEVFEQRPIPDGIIDYCVGDVQYLSRLWSKFRSSTDRWRDLVTEETKKRVEASQKPEYQPHGKDRTLAPWSVDQNRTLDEWFRIYLPPSHNYFDEDDYGGFHEDDDWIDDGPTSCRDIINDCDMDYYYSD